MAPLTRTVTRLLSLGILLLIPTQLSALLSAPVLAAPDTSSGNVTVVGIKPLLVATVREGESLNMNITATDSDAGANLRISVASVVGNPGNIGFQQSLPYAPAAGPSPHTVSLTGTAGSPGLLEMLVTVSDGLLVDLFTLTLTVLPAGNLLPSLGTPLSQTGLLSIEGAYPLFTVRADVGAQFDLSLPATDPNSDDLLDLAVSVAAGPLTPSAAGLSELLPLSVNLGASPVALELSGTALEPGSITLDVAVSDGRGGTDLISIVIVIQDPAGAEGITLSGELQPFATSGTGVPSSVQWYLVAGSGLSDAIEISPADHFEVSLNSDSGFSSAPLVLSESGGSVVATRIYVRFSPSATGAHSAAISHASAGVATVNLTVQGATHGSLSAVLSAGPAAVASFAPGRTVRALHAYLDETSGTEAFVITTLQVAVHSTAAKGIGPDALAEMQLFFNGVKVKAITGGVAGWTSDSTDIFVTFTGLALVVAPGTRASIEVALKSKKNSLPIAKEPVYQAKMEPNYINGGSGVTGDPVIGPVLDLQNIPDNDFDRDNSCAVRSGGTFALIAMILAALGCGLGRARRTSGVVQQ